MLDRPVRYAVVGLGHIAKSAVLPAFGKPEAGRSKLTALVSGDRAKLDELGEKFGVEQRATYDEFDELCNNGAIDAAYITLPNDQHRNFTERAARFGVHVLCEKPLALSVEDCRAMIEETRSRSVKLMTAYRLHFEPANTAAIKLIHDGRIGDPRMFASQFSFQVNPPNLRLEGAHGGGTIWDIGVYCINAARHVFAGEPTEVQAASFNNGEPRFREVDEMTSVILRFPQDKSAVFTTSFGTTSCMYWRVVGTKGIVHVEPAYGYRGKLKVALTIDGKTEETEYGPTDQFAPELAHFSDCILENREPGPNGEEGLCDVAVVEKTISATATRSNV